MCCFLEHLHKLQEVSFSFHVSRWATCHFIINIPVKCNWFALLGSIEKSLVRRGGGGSRLLGSDRDFAIHLRGGHSFEGLPRFTPWGRQLIVPSVGGYTIQNHPSLVRWVQSCDITVSVSSVGRITWWHFLGLPCRNIQIWFGNRDHDYHFFDNFNCW